MTSLRVRYMQVAKALRAKLQIPTGNLKDGHGPDCLVYPFVEKHSLDFLAGQEQQRNTTNGYGLDRQTLSDLSYTVIQGGFTTPNTAGLITTENYLLSYFGRLNYNFDQKYYLTGNIRQDEYSALGIKRGVFYGFGAGWELTKESFWDKAGLNKVFSSFRLSGSYGKVGNVAV